MESRFNAILEGKDLLEEIPEIRILDIEHTPASISDMTFSPGFTSRPVITDRRYSGAKVSIPVEIHEYDPTIRSEVRDKLLEWAIGGGVLMTTDRPGQRLNVVCANAPAIASALRWTDRVTVEFSATGNPFWEAEIPQKFVFTTSDYATVNGCVSSARVRATVKSGNTTNSGDKFTELEITCAGESLKLSGLNVPKNRKILIDYDANDFLTIKTDNGDDLMQYRTGADELLLPCGKKSRIKITANTAVTCTLEVRGLWL